MLGVSVRPLLTQTTRLMPASFSAMALLAHGTQQFIDGEQGDRDEKCLRKEPHGLREQQKTSATGRHQTNYVEKVCNIQTISGWPIR